MANSPFSFPKNRRTRWMDENLWENLDLGSSRVCFRTRVKLLEIDARCTRWTRALVRYTCEFIDISWNTAGTAGANQMKPKPDHYSARRKVGGNGETSGKTFLLPPFSCFFPPISPLRTLDKRPFAAHRLTRRWWQWWGMGGGGSRRSEITVWL